jgi:signal transduction histidine kinase
MIRHDLKGPLAGVIGLVQDLLTSGGELNHQQQEQLRLVEETALQLVNMVNLSSELLKIETHTFVLAPKPVSLADILRRMAEVDRITYASKWLTISVDTDTPVGSDVPQALGDAMLCYSIFQNLLKNACEAAPANSTIFIRQLDQSPLQVVISNQGAVPTEIRGQFFDKFVTHGKPGGTGLGTYSAKLLTEAQGGQIDLAVDDGHNSTTITVRLPRWLS